MSASSIPYATEAWNPVRTSAGLFVCDRMSPGCERCWFQRMFRRFRRLGRRGIGKLGCWGPELKRVETWRKPRTVAVQFAGDLFHQRVPDGVIGKVLGICEGYRKHRWLVLTKRAFRLRCLAGSWKIPSIPNIWYGVTCESDGYARQRLSDLAFHGNIARQWASFEPLLGPIDLAQPAFSRILRLGQVIQWAVIGCESGPGARPCDLAWIRALVEQCREFDVPVYVKQVRLPGGAGVSYDPAEWPEDLRIRELPWRNDYAGRS